MSKCTAIQDMDSLLLIFGHSPRVRVTALVEAMEHHRHPTVLAQGHSFRIFLNQTMLHRLPHKRRCSHFHAQVSRFTTHLTVIILKST